jgi:peptide/nickel transport system ATP-binding protein
MTTATAEVSRVEDATMLYPAGRREPVRAVDGVNLTLNAGEVVAIVGESGSGKTTLGRMLLRLVRPSAGRIWFGGTDITNVSDRALRPLRPQMQLVFQDPYSSLNPRMSVGSSVGYVLAVNGLSNRRDRAKRVAELLDRVGLDSNHARRLPHQLSGGQRQRVAVARAIAASPRLIVADEPVSALDLSTQAQVLNLFRELQQELGAAIAFITHDLAVAEYIADRVVVMYAGRIVEQTAATFESAVHPYSKALGAAALLEESTSLILDGEPPNPRRLPTGCAFHPRCPHTMDRCRTERPHLQSHELGSDNLVACHLLQPDRSMVTSPD